MDCILFLILVVLYLCISMLQYLLRYTNKFTILEEHFVFLFGLYNIFQQELQGGL